MVSTHASTVLKEKLAVIMAEFQSLFGKELYSVDTLNDAMFKFFAFHFTWYNRYSESVSCSIFTLHVSVTYSALFLRERMLLLISILISLSGRVP